MCKDIAHGGVRCDRTAPTPGAPASAPERALTRAERVAADTRDEAAQEIDDALDRLFTSVAEADSPEERARALSGWLDRVGHAFVRLARALERVHARRLAARDARFAAHLAGELSAVREARYTEERASLERLHAAELVLAEVELQARTPDWSDERLWREVETASLEFLGSELLAERDNLVVLERRAARGAPDPRVISEARSTRARVRCWALTLERRRSTLAGLPRTEAEAGAAVARARADVDAARAAAGLTDEDRYLTHPELMASVEHSRRHPEERRSRAPRGTAQP